MSDIQMESPLKLEDDEKEITSKVQKFYEKIQFPGHRPIEQDSLIFLRKFSKLINSFAGKNLPLNVLDAGCGTGNTSLELAALFKDVQFVGVDISTTSLDTARKKADEMNLSNVKFCEWNLLNPFTDKNKFNIILSFGVLHHTAQMQKVLDNFFSALEQNGTLFLWIYGKYGRYFHSLNVELLSILLSASHVIQNKINFTREFIINTNGGRILRDLLGTRSEDQMLRPFYNDPTWIADQFLNPNEFLVSMKDLIVLVRNSGFKISEWIGAPKDISKCFNSQKLVNRFEMLSPEKQMIALDLLLKMERYFLVIKKIKTG